VNRPPPSSISTTLLVAAVLLNSSSSICAQQANSAASAPAAAAQAPVTQTTPSEPPLPNRMNEVLPRWLRVRGEFRERFEGFANSGFRDANDDAYYLTRVRLNASVTASKSLSFQVQAQDARVADKTIGPNNAAPFHGTFDVRTAFADIGASGSAVTARLGRQDLSYGDQRLLGALPWTNTARSFDAARVTLKSRAASVDVFAASIVRILPAEFDKSGNGNRLVGAYGSLRAVLPRGVIEPYVLWHRDVNLRSELGPTGELHQYTTGARIAGSLPARFDYVVEMDRQTGSVGPDNVSAWAGHWQLRETLAGAKSVRLAGEYNYASGDSDPRDGRRGTFDQLYPTGHDKYGLADLVGWRNISHVRAGFEITPVARLPVMAHYHSWWLADGHDALYTASSAVLVPAIAAGAPNRHVGQEIDLQVSRVLAPQLSISGGYAHVVPGAFLEQGTPGRSYSYPYVMATYVFLADR
jgi:hypothetical protein